MSLSGRGPRSFLGPLMGKTTTFLLDGRRTNIAFAKMVMESLGHARTPCAILDLDAFYSSNADKIFSPAENGIAKSSVIHVPRPGSDIEPELSGLFEDQQTVLIIDSLNTLYHLLSQEDGRSRGRKFTYALASLSYLARTNQRAVILTMYRRDGLHRAGTAKSISGLSDSVSSVEIRDGELKVDNDSGEARRGVP